MQANACQGRGVAKLGIRQVRGNNSMQPHSLVAIVTLLALLTYFWMGLQVAGARGKSGIQAPAMTGHPLLERAVRVHYNTLEWLPMFLVSMWLFAVYWNDLVAAGLAWSGSAAAWSMRSAT